MYRKWIPALLILTVTGCAGLFGVGDLNSKREHDLRVGNIPGALHPEWKESDRCTKCHIVWSWEFGYYRGWDRHGFIYDYYKTAPYGYRDPYGLDASWNPYIEYYQTDWWNGAWFSEAERPDPPMHFDGYGSVNDGTAQPGDFDGTVIVVDQSGNGDATTIQEAVDRAKPGATVFVRPGTYPECVRLKEGIRLWGQNPHTTIINPDFTGSAIVAANRCDISGFTLTGTGMNYKTYDFSSGVHALDCDSTLVIRGNIFDSNAVFGVLVESSRAGGTPKKQEKRYITPKDAFKNLDYDGFPNPRVIGNTFSMIGERAVYCIHSAPEVANNVFIGNVKTVGMTQHSKPFVHHNVFYRNNVALNMNRSTPVVAYNILIRNYWGQRVIEGSCPRIHDNVTYQSPYYKEFAEDGRPILYTPRPGNGELAVDPKCIDPDGGDFGLSADSPLRARASGTKTYGLVSGQGIQQPPVVRCERSYAEGFNNRNKESDSVVAAIRDYKKKLGTLHVSYTITYKSFLDVTYDTYGDQATAKITANPVSGMTYDVPLWTMDGAKRRKVYRSSLFSPGRSLADSGTVIYDGKKLIVLSGRYKEIVRTFDDPYEVGEVTFRENTGGLYLDYDQFLNGSIGPMGTFFYGYLTIFGGEVQKEREVVDGHECVVIIYPNIGEDLKYRFYLDAEDNYIPRKIEQYFDRKLYRRIDGYRYREINGVYLPMEVAITDYAVRKPYVGKVAGVLWMKVSDIGMGD